MHERTRPHASFFIPENQGTGQNNLLSCSRLHRLKVNLGGTSVVVNVHIYAFWETLHVEVPSPEKFSNVSNVKMPRETGCHPRGMTTKA